MAIIRQFDKRSGTTYIYDSKFYYDKEKKLNHILPGTDRCTACSGG